MNELAIWRFVLGIGAGGVYPLAAVMSAEDREGDECESDEASEAGNSGELPRIALTFSTQGLGFLAVPLELVMPPHQNGGRHWKARPVLPTTPNLALRLSMPDWRRKQHGATIAA